ncbi:MAG: glucose-1-phosphate adenylyltransferase [Clostridia bacterium]|nr:glucose-1-phosphate adenylyltransferase [Clostridia bacterium]MBQ5487751.1 glucose-1-phosphate adenylyltransferase [Clostridia bacterium]
MPAKKIVAMLLAGGQGSRLGELTKSMAKPAVPFGGKYRIIDFPLSNCVNSDIDTVGVLTQYEPLALNAYLGNGQAWDLDRNNGGVFVLPPYVSLSSDSWYSGTANAIYQNIPFIDQYDPEYVLILSGDHIYKMDYAEMLRRHVEKKADATIAVLTVPIEEAHRFGIMNTDSDGRIIEFEEKPKQPKSTKASMGIYIFSYPVLKQYLIADARNEKSENDFGKNIIPSMIADGKRMFAWDFAGYWRDVGTIGSLWEANMDLLGENPPFDLYDKEWRIYSRSPIMPPHYVSGSAEVDDSLVTEGCVVSGRVRHSVLFAGVRVEEGAYVEDSIIMPGSVIGSGAIVKKAIVGENAIIGENATIGCPKLPEDGDYDTKLTGDITLIANSMLVSPGARVPQGKVVSFVDDPANK